MTLYDIIVDSAKAALNLLRGDGSIPEGHNGPYRDPETPVRNTAHWLISFAKAHSITADSRFMEAVERCSDYLTNDKARPMDGAFFCRTNPEKDFCNGLIGQAWVFEALKTASDVLGDDVYIGLARDVYKKHPFDEKSGLWRRLNVDGSYNDFDMTFNHQLWFAACSTLIGETSSEIGQQVERFIGNLNKNLLARGSGRIAMYVPESAVDGAFVGSIKALRRKFTTNAERRRFEKEREIGYHQFNLYAFAMLREKFGDNPFWHSRRFVSILKYIETSEYKTAIRANTFGYPYNPPGFECAYAILAFPEHFDEPEKLAKSWVTEQIKKCFNHETNLMSLNSSDEATSAARIYEATRLPNMELEI